MMRIPLTTASRVVDLGCGTGELTKRLAERYDGARVTGLDSSADMLAKAASIRGVDWVQADISNWRPDGSLDLIYTNAALQWLPDHTSLFPRLISYLRSGGVFACQMPYNYEEPSHRGMRDLAGSPRWASKLATARPIGALPRPDAYIDWLSPLAARIDIWETRYWQVLTGDDPILEWVKGTGLRPFLDVLGPEHRPVFLADYAAAMRACYPRRADGTTLYPFPRLFMIIARR
jgi:trans-aconitate 2-methyltransferase